MLGPLLNDYLTGMTDIVFAHEGTVAKIIGDAIHVLFGAPGEQSDHASRAVVCALALDDYAQATCERYRAKGLALGLTRIGAHAGPAIVGAFGGGHFFDYTAYGDTINVAARLEGANKRSGTRICVSATLAGKVEDFTGRPVGDLVLRGKTEALRAFEPLPARAIRQSSDQELPGRIRQARSQRSWRGRRLCRPSRQGARGPARQLSSQAALERCDRHPDCDGARALSRAVRQQNPRRRKVARRKAPQLSLSARP